MDILDYTKFVIRDREECYQDLTLFVQATKIGTDELREIVDENEKVRILIESADGSIREATAMAEEAIKEPWLLGVWKGFKRGIVWFGAGAGTATLLILTSNN